MPIRVLVSLRQIRPTTNPYIAQLIAGLEQSPDMEVVYFSFRRAILGRYDVFHVHWPEVLFTSGRPVGRLARLVLTSLLVLRFRLLRTAVVRTWHNTERPDGIGGWGHCLLDQIDNSTRAVVSLNPLTDVPLLVPIVVVPHGHYRDWFETFDRHESVPGLIGYVGLVRRYKGVETLVQTFREIADPGLGLAISGKPSNPEIAQKIRQMAGDDPRVTLRFDYLDDAEFVAEVTRAQLVVLPYRHMHNSGTVLAALSLDRPVLVPDNATNKALSEEVGRGWIHFFDGELTQASISAALTATAGPDRGSRPNLDAREWKNAAEGHLQAYRAALRPRRRSDTRVGTKTEDQNVKSRWFR